MASPINREGDALDLKHRATRLQSLSWKYSRIGLFSGMLWDELERGGLTWLMEVKIRRTSSL